VDLSSRLRSILRDAPAAQPQQSEKAQAAPRELTYEPDIGRYEATVDPGRLGEMLGGRLFDTAFGRCLVIDRRYEADRRHGGVHIRDCELSGSDVLTLLDPSLGARCFSHTLFLDLETTGLSGGAGTVAFLVGCGYFDLGAFQIRQFLLTSFAGERALLAALAEFFEGTDLIVTYNGKTFDVPVMETRWVFHHMRMPLESVPHFDMLHPARRLWSSRLHARAGGPEYASTRAGQDAETGCKLTTLERVLFDVRRVEDLGSGEIPSRFFQFLRTGNPRPLEPVLEHNRIDLVSLAAVTARAAGLAKDGATACRDTAEALALGRIYDRAGALDRAESCYRHASSSGSGDIRGEALYRLGITYRRQQRFEEAAAVWRQLLALPASAARGRKPDVAALRQCATEALAIYQEHRARDYFTARKLALWGLDQAGEGTRRAAGMRHRLARLDRKIARSAPLFSYIEC
jgi:uncharacterized protein YprB with RNaseH-like and TPR domain